MFKVKKFENIEKFVQEVFWRTYWKGWLKVEMKYGKNTKSLLELNQLYSRKGKKKELSKCFNW